MEWNSIVAIYGLFWVLSCFVMLPFGMKTHDELGIDRIPGQADSAPGNFRPGRVIMRGSMLAALLTTVYVANYAYGWVGVEDLDFMRSVNNGEAG
ncbi:MAG: DUF1467 family protein [Qipengyuania sp.]